MNPINELTKFIGKKSLADAAKELKVAPSNLSQCVTGTKKFGPKLLKALGIEKVVTYRRINSKAKK